MKLSVSVRPNAAVNCDLTMEQLRAIAAALVIELPCGVRMVQYSPTAPADTTLPWQPTDECGGYPVGVVKTYKNGAWA